MTDIQRAEQSGLSEKYKRFQLYSVQIAMGALSSFLILSTDKVEKVFTKAHLEGFYAMFFVVIIVIGIVAVFFSGGVGLLRLINAKRVLQMIEQDQKKGK